MLVTLSIPASYRRRAYQAVNYRLRTFAGGRLRRYLRPVSISLLLTRRCNARCAHCDIWKNRGPEETATAEQWKRLLFDLRSWLGPVHLFITGGEPLLQPYATDLVAHGSAIGLAVELLTNGYWEDQTGIEQLARANPWRVTLSVDGIGQTHSRIRGHDDFWDCTFQSIETLRRVRERERAKYTVLLKTVIMAQNLDDVVDVARFAAENELEVFYQPVERNYNTAANGIATLLKNDELRSRMGMAGRGRVQDHFTLDKMVERTIHLYEELLSN